MAGIGKKSIHQWTEDARPREKMMKYGADSLTNAELLAILIGSGTREEDAVSLMQRILDDHCNNLDDFCRLDCAQHAGTRNREGRCWPIYERSSSS